MCGGICGGFFVYFEDNLRTEGTFEDGMFIFFHRGFAIQ